MSDEEGSSESATAVLTAEYKDGQFEIVNVSPPSRSKFGTGVSLRGHMDPESSSSDENQLKYVQVLDSHKNVVVDLLNLTLVKCGDGQDGQYRLVSSAAEDGEAVTCVLADEEDGEHNSSAYMVMDDTDGSVVFLETPPPAEPTAPQPVAPEPADTNTEQPALTPVEILERAKTLQKTKALMSLAIQHTTSRGRRSKTQLPPPHELLSSPRFKLFLYSCKLCSFKCNAIKELTAHKAAEHTGGGGKWRTGSRASAITLQCARCPYRGNTHSQLMRHVKDKHVEVTTVTTSVGLLESAEVSEADVLVCGACGFESSAREVFKKHIQEEHGVTAC